MPLSFRSKLSCNYLHGVQKRDIPYLFHSVNEHPLLELGNFFPN
jgi:hypothetical protein